MESFLEKKVIADKTILCTLCNFGYRFYTHNLLKSLEKVGLGKNLCIFCYDEECFNYFKNHNIEAFHYKTVDHVNILKYGTEEFRDITFEKIPLTYHILKLGYNVMFTDGDIVFLKNPVQFMMNELKDFDFVVQNDIDDDEIIKKTNDGRSIDRFFICTGFYLAKSCKEMIDLFDPAYLDPAAIKEMTGEQKYLCNRIFNGDWSVKRIPQKLFPNGLKFMKYIGISNIKNTAFLVHFNWMDCSKKIEIMLEHQMWFL